MRFSFTAAAVLALASVASAQTLTGAFDCLTSGVYTLCQNQWGASECHASIRLLYVQLTILRKAPVSESRTLP